MAQNEEPMDVDCMDSDFDNKENTYHHSNVLPCTEKGYEELDVSELNMKLRYSITPVASPMSKSYTSYVDNKNLDSEDSINCTNENANLTRSLNSTMTKNDSVIKSLKPWPLQSISTEQVVDNRASVLRQLDSTISGDDNNVTVTISQANDINENESLPSSSSSAIQTPEATSPINMIKNEEGSPIIRGLKSVFNMFRSSQSPIPPVDNDILVQQERPLDETYCEDPKPQALASTPISTRRSRDGSSKRGSPLKDSIVFNDDLEKELQWKEETILFSEEKIPIHKLFLPQNKPMITASPQKDQKLAVDNLDSTAEYMDVSYNSSRMDITLTEAHNNTNAVESDGEFVDCETTFNKNESQNARKEELQENHLGDTLEVFDVTKDTEPEVNESVKIFENKIQNECTDAPQTLDITRDIVLENVSVMNNIVESKEKQDMPSSGPVTFDVTIDDVENASTENKCVSSDNPIQEDSLDAMKTLDITKEIVSESVSDINENLGRTDFEIQKEPSAETLDVTIEVQDEKETTVNDCSLPETAIALVVEDNTCLTPKPILENIVLNVDNVEDNSLKEEKLRNEFLVIENLEVSNEINQAEINIEVDKEEPKPEINLNVTQLTENEKTIGREIEIYIDPAIVLITKKETNFEVAENPTKDLQVLEDKKNVYIKTDHTELNLVAYPPEDAANATISVSLKSDPDNTIQIEKQAQPPNDFDAKPEETPQDIAMCNLHTEEPANIPLPDHDDFDIGLDPNIDKLEITQAMPPDVLDTVNTESKLDFTETLNKISYDTNIIKSVNGEPKTQPTSEIQEALNETNYIINSLTEIIGESQNNTIIQPGSMFDQSQNNEMEGIECTGEIHVLPDLVNETINNMSVDGEITPELINQTHPGPSTETDSVPEMHRLSNVLETIPDLTEENNSISESLGIMMVELSTKQNSESINENKEHTDTEENKSISETLGTMIDEYATKQNSESINENKEHTDTIVPTANIDVSSATNLKDTKDNEVENVQKENKVLVGDVIPNDEISEVPIVDEELVLSENNSPYVSVIAETESKVTEECFEKNDILLNTISDAPSSPPIRSKGYNFNFDEMDDPFATKTKIRLSPPSTPSKLNEPDDEDNIKSGFSKKVAPNRRRSQPPERKRPINKKKFKTTFDADSSPNSRTNDQNFGVDSQTVSDDITKNTTITIDNNNEVDKEVALILDSTTNMDVTSENDLSNVQLQENITPATDITVEISTENKSSIESMSTAISEVKTSSSDQSTYYSAAASSSDSFISRNVFNLPEIDDKNFNPFATKSKMRQSPPLDLGNENPFVTKSKMMSSPDSSMMVLPCDKNTQNIIDAEDKMDTELMEKDSSYNGGNSTSLSKETDEKNIPIREVNTEDEDTEEGPFLEAEDAIDKFLAMDNDDMMQFNEIPSQATDENADGGELFIDAEAFEFLLNQNKSNVVADSGKESLFLKFDPLFTKRISSDGMLAALNKVQKRQSTPTKPTRPFLRNEASPIAGPSTFNATYDEETSATQDSIDDLNITVAKPMMVVTPAVNPAVTPRNKTTTPPRSNRRSITFTSPAMAVIDRLLSLSGHNNSVLGQDTTITQRSSREHIEADLALTQLRELLAEKEISVYQLRSESKELKDRLSTMETHVKILQADGQERFNKINELNDRLTEKTKINKSMAAVVEEYERTIASLISETEQDKKRHADERIRLINERDEQTAHLTSMEVSFSDLHSKYEKSKQVILSCKANEETCKKSIKDFEENLTKMQANYEMLKQHATSKLNQANQELQKMNRAHESEVLKLNAMIKRKEMHITSLEETLAQKTKANEELTAICDELINKVG